METDSRDIYGSSNPVKGKGGISGNQLCMAS